MRQFVLLVTLCFLSSFATAQKLTVIDDFSDFETNYIQKQSDDTIYVYNFWATWCKPCVAELPYFSSLNNHEGATPIKLVLVSLDFKQQIETRLKPFIHSNNITNEVVVLADGNTNKWINQVDSSWSGAIPATLVYHDQKKLFYEKTYHSYEELLKSILKIIL